MGSLKEVPHLLVYPPREDVWGTTHKLKLWFPTNGFFYDWLPRTFSNSIVGFVVQDSFAIMDEILWGYVVQPDSIGIDVAYEVGVRVKISV
jgi:hypothetical protein